MQHHQKIILPTNRGTFYFSPEEIIRLEACSNYTNIYFTNKKKMLTSRVLKDFAIQLEPLGFLRTHRTHLVNRLHVLCVTPEGNIIMKDASTAGISRRKKRHVMELLRN